MEEKLNELLKKYRTYGENEADDNLGEIWMRAADMLQYVLSDYSALDSENDILECGCVNDEFGCQGYHGT